MNAHQLRQTFHVYPGRLYVEDRARPAPTFDKLIPTGLTQHPEGEIITPAVWSALERRCGS